MDPEELEEKWAGHPLRDIPTEELKALRDHHRKALSDPEIKKIPVGASEVRKVVKMMDLVLKERGAS